jgi:NAD+ diphosphatase
VSWASNGKTPAFTGASLDRAAIVRHDRAQVAVLLASPSARAVAAGAGGVVVSGGSLARIPLDGNRPVRLACEAGTILLGLEAEHPLFALDLDALAPDKRGGVIKDGELVGLRDAGTTLEPSEGGLAAYLTALLNWHRRHRYCPNCGGGTEIADAGLSRRCEVCGEMHFPRTDPVVIMCVEHDDRLLLGRRTGWPPRRYSVLAGFVAPGETPEEAVVREVYEESGIESHEPVYIASQPWPFPASLMLGFQAQSPGGEPRVHDGELEQVGWFSRREVALAAREGSSELLLPPPISIARNLIDRWIDRERCHH